MATIAEEKVETQLAKGVRNRWYIIAPSAAVTNKPASLRRAGYKIVLWRDEAGDICAVEDHCPHRGAPLSLGIPLGNRIACGYHGVQVDKDGRVVKVPGSPGCKLEGQRATKAFSLQERNGMIFAWVGDELHEDAAELLLPEELTSSEFSSFPCYVEWNTEYRYVIDNIMDPMHGAYLHRQSHTLSFGEVQATFRIRKTDTGFVFEKEGQRNVNFDWVEFGDTNIHWMRLEVPYPKIVGPGGNFHIIASVTPISDTKCAAVFWRCRRVQDWRRDAWRFLYRNRVEARHWHVLEQDRVMAEAMEVDARQRESLYQHDVGLARVRRYLHQTASDQLAALADRERQ